jgi:hypothetical protein
MTRGGQGYEMRSIGVFLLAAAFGSSALAETKFHFDTGQGWRGEQMKVPPRFAPGMTWKGSEDIRFAPGMYRPESEMFFTYAFVMLLDEGAEVSQEAIQGESLLYFQGLARAVMRGKRMPVDTDTFVLKLEEAKAAQEKSAHGETTTFTGTLDWIEPFATQAPQQLYLQITTWKHGLKTALFFAVSPKAPDHRNWNELQRIQESFRFEN